MNKNNIITVTSPLLPNLDEFHELLKEIWESKWITNNGSFHQQLEAALRDYLKVPYVSLFTNGTLPLITALQALHITGEVITTPYSFVATTHALWWNGIKPVFVDIDWATGCMDPNKIEAAITPKTTAIMPVHVYGKPCDTKAIQDIADKYGLKVIYDAAHAFGVEQDGISLMNFGDMSTLSFHATKVYNTVEGGALIMHDEKTKKRIDYLKNFGFAGETEVVAPGINSKMDEMRAAYGLLNLKQVDQCIEARHQVAIRYRQALHNIEGTRVLAHLDRLRIDAEDILASVNSLGNGLTDAFSKRHRLLAPLVVLPTGNQVWNGSRALGVQPVEEVVLAVDTERLCCNGKSHHLQVGEGGDNTAASDISFLVYLIFCKFLANLKNFSELCDEVVHIYDNST